MRRVRFIFAWYDGWIGLYWDRKTRSLFILPIPMCGVVIHFTKYVKGEIVQIAAFAGLGEAHSLPRQKITKVWIGKSGNVLYNTEHCRGLTKNNISKIKE